MPATDEMVDALTNQIADIMWKSMQETKKLALDFHDKHCNSPEETKEECALDWAMYLANQVQEELERRCKTAMLNKSPRMN